MKEQVDLVDIEYVRKLDLSRLPAHARIKIFVGAQRAEAAKPEGVIAANLWERAYA